MKNKFIGILGIFFIIFSIAAYFAYSNTIKNNSEVFGKSILVLSKDVKAGEPLNESNLIAKKVKLTDLSSKFLTENDLSKLNGKVAAIDLFKNEQLTLERVTSSLNFKPVTSQMVSLEITSVNALSGNIQEGDIVNLWDNANIDSVQPIKKLSNVRVVAIKDAQNQNIKDVPGAIPTSIIVRLDNDEQIAIAKKLARVFVTKSENQVGTKLETSKHK